MCCFDGTFRLLSGRARRLLRPLLQGLPRRLFTVSYRGELRSPAVPSVGACFARPRATTGRPYILFPKLDPNRSPAQRVRFGEEGQGSGADGGETAAGARADFAPTRSPLQPHHRPSSRRGELRSPAVPSVGACFARPRATTGRPYILFPKLDPNRSPAQRVRFGEEGQGSGADGGETAAGARADFAPTWPPLQPHHRPLSRRGELRSPAVSPVRACFARPRATPGRPYILFPKLDPNRSPARGGGQKTDWTRIPTRWGGDFRRRCPLGHAPMW